MSRGARARPAEREAGKLTTGQKGLFLCRCRHRPSRRGRRLRPRSHWCGRAALGAFLFVCRFRRVSCVARAPSSGATPAGRPRGSMHSDGRDSRCGATCPLLDSARRSCLEKGRCGRRAKRRHAAKLAAQVQHGTLARLRRWQSADSFARTSGRPNDAAPERHTRGPLSIRLGTQRPR